ncbi:MAG: hypothetical protein QM535_03605 [Limnohabitans sp.]|nr:hypothetical protein [Limnohabitans sp.]
MKLINFNSKHLKVLLLLILSIVAAITIKHFYYSKTEFIVLSHLSRINNEDNSIEEFILVKNPPQKSADLKKMIIEFNSKRHLKYKKAGQLFLKEHKQIYLPRIISAFWLYDNYSYLDEKTNRDMLDNADFLAKQNHFLLNNNEKGANEIYLYIGKYCYYEK